jgi:biopolymer transport protein ExbD
MLMRISRATRIAIYMLVAGYALDFLAYSLGIPHTRIPGIGPFSAFFTPAAVVLLIGLAIGKSYGKAYWPGEETSLTLARPQAVDLHLEREAPSTTPPEAYRLQAALPWGTTLGLGMIVLGLALANYAKHSADYDLVASARWFTAVLVFGGLGSLGTSVVEHSMRSRTRKALLNITDRPYPQYLSVARKAAPKRFTTLPPFGLTAVLVVVLTAVFFWIQPIQRNLRGIYVHLFAERVAPRTTARIEEPIVLRVVLGPAPDYQWRYFLNSKPIAREQLGTALLAELKLRSEWVVYVDGDREIPYEAAVSAMDEALGVKARVVLLTPKMKAGAVQHPLAHNNAASTQN